MTNRTQSGQQSLLGVDISSQARLFWKWWTGELKQIVPRWLWQDSEVSDAWVVVEFAESQMFITRWFQGRAEQDESIQLKATDTSDQISVITANLLSIVQSGDKVALGISPGQYLCKEITMPLAAAENLHQVMGFEMDRHTPFKADHVYYHADEISRDDDRLKIATRLHAVPRKIIDAKLDLLSSCQVTPQAVFVLDENRRPDRTFNLLPSASNTRVGSRLRDRIREHLKGFRLLFLVLLLALIATALAIPIVQKRQAVIHMLAEVERAQAEAAQASAQRRVLEELTAEYNFVLNKKKATVPVIVLLDEVAKLLPDDTWVEQLDLRGRELQIRGETASSSKLIVLVEGASLFSEANFLAPLTTASSGKETYHIGARIEAQDSVDLAAAGKPQKGAR